MTNCRGLQKKVTEVWFTLLSIRSFIENFTSLMTALFPLQSPVDEAVLSSNSRWPSVLICTYKIGNRRGFHLQLTLYVKNLHTEPVSATLTAELFIVFMTHVLNEITRYIQFVQIYSLLLSDTQLTLIHMKSYQNSGIILTRLYPQWRHTEVAVSVRMFHLSHNLLYSMRRL